MEEVKNVYVEKSHELEEEKEFKAVNLLAKEHLEIIATEIDKINDLGLEFHYGKDVDKYLEEQSHSNRWLDSYRKSELKNDLLTTQRTILISAFVSIIIVVVAGFLF